MSQLEYDDSAFVFFGLATISVFTIPYTLSFIRNNFFKSKIKVKTGELLSPRSSVEAKKLDRLKRTDKSVKQVASCGFFFKLAFLVACWAAILSLVTRLGHVGEMKVFDPFEILELSSGASNSEIKSAYRRLSKTWHPDGHIGDTKAEAERRFMQIRRAYESLTDEVARRNLEEYGNPDGKQPMEVSLGLPTWLLMKENHNLVLVIYLLILVIAIPLVVGTYYSNSKLYGEKMILNESYKVYAYLLNNVTMKHMPEVLALSAEFRTMPYRPEDEKVLERLKRTMMLAENMVKKPSPNAVNLFKRWPQCDKVNTLLHAHMNRLVEEENLTPELLDDTDQILRKVPMLLDAMIEVAQARRSFLLINRIVELSQFLVQALWINSSPLQQLPHFTKAEVKHATSGKAGIRSIEQFLEEDDSSQTRKKGMAGFTDEQCQDVEKIAQMLPIMDLNVQIGVMNYEEENGTVIFEEIAAQGDAITIYIELKYKRDPKTKNRNVVHAPYFPMLLNDSWQLSLTKADDDFCISSTKISDIKDIFRHKLIFPSHELKPGTHLFDVHLTSFCYVGLDQKKTVKVDLKPFGTVKAPETHPEDLAIAQEPALFDLMAGITHDDNSDFESDDETEKSKEAKDSKTDKSAKEAAAVEDSDDDLVAVEHSDAPLDAK